METISNESKERQLARQLEAVSKEISKKDRYEACLEFRNDRFNPLDIRTVDDMLSGNPEKIKNPELAEKLLKFFQARANEYAKLEQQRKSA